MSTIIKRYLTPAKQSYFLFGPRGTGKSTWLHMQYPEGLFIDLLNPAILRQYLAYPERLEEAVKGSQAKTIIIDEVQKAPELLSVVHRLIEQKQGWQFVLTGSSSRKLKQSGIDLLAGRAVVRHMHPFMASELGENFSLDSALQYGLVPLIFESEDISETLQAYISIYLNEEVKAERLVRNIGDFARFLEIASLSQGSIINVSNIARECMVSRKLVEGYLGVLEDLLLSYYLPVFSLRAKRKIVNHPKFYYFDAGVYRSLRMTGLLDQTSELNGPGLEGLVLQHLYAWNDYQGAPNKLYYWRTKHGVEVDFIVYGKTGFYAIEVKNSKFINDKDILGLETFCMDYPEAMPIMLYGGQERLKKKSVVCLPVEKFLKELSPLKPFPVGDITPTAD